MSLNTVCWSVFITGLFMIIAGVGLAIWAMRGSSLLQNNGGLFAIVLAGGIFLGCYLVSPYIPHIASVAKNEYVETEATVVECVFQKTTRHQDKYKRLIIYFPETDEYYEINIVGQSKKFLDIQEGKTFCVKYYPFLLERPNSNDRLVEFLYCVDDLNE